MNATYNIDHLQAITHVSALLNTGTTLGDAATISKPKMASTSHYDPAGTSVATVSNTSYEGVNFAADGSIAGGSLSHESSVPGGSKLSTTSVSFGSNGKPGSAQITAHNKNGEGDFKKIQMDMSGATWNDSFAISTGEVKMTTTDVLTGQKKHDGALQFNNEVVSSGSFTHYAPDGSGSVSGYSKVDYSSAKFLGANIVGGQYAVNAHAADNALKSTSLISVSPLGQVHAIETTNMNNGAAASVGVSSKVMVDFSKITFNARNEFESGDVEYTVNDSAGTLLSKTTVTYSNTNPALSATTVYKNGQLQSKVVIDYGGSQFNNDHQVVNSTKRVQTFSGDNKLISDSVISYDQHGNKVKETPASAAQAAAPPKAAAPPVNNNPAPVTRLVAATGDGTTEKTEKKNRTDNTLEWMRVITMQGDKPVFVTITLYAADGVTVTKTHSMDLSGLSYDQQANTVSGGLKMQTHAGGSTLSAESTVQY